MKSILNIVLINFLLACNTSQNIKNDLKEKHLLQLKKDFKHKNLNAFSLESFNWETGPNQYKQLDSNWFNLVWQYQKKTFDPEGFNRDFLYSWQERDSNLIELTILQLNEGDNGPVISYCIFDKNGKAIDQFIASANCADGGWFFESYGRFINGNTYEAVSVEQEFIEMDSLDNKEIYEGDSTIVRYTIGLNGKVSEKKVSKKTFTIRE